MPRLSVVVVAVLAIYIALPNALLAATCSDVSPDAQPGPEVPAGKYNPAFTLPYSDACYIQYPSNGRSASEREQDKSNCYGLENAVILEYEPDGGSNFDLCVFRPKDGIAAPSGQTASPDDERADLEPSPPALARPPAPVEKTPLQSFNEVWNEPEPSHSIPASPSIKTKPPSPSMQTIYPDMAPSDKNLNHYKYTSVTYSGCEDEHPYSLFVKGPIAFSCKHTELAHLNGITDLAAMKFMATACGRGDTEVVARFHASARAKQLVFDAQLKKARSLNADPDRNEIFLTDRLEEHCVRTQ